MKIQDEVAVLVNTCKKNVIKKTKVEIRFSDFTDKDKTVYKWRARLPMTEDSVTAICRYHHLFYSDLFFKKHRKCCNVYDIHKKTRS